MAEQMSSLVPGATLISRCFRSETLALEVALSVPSEVMLTTCTCHVLLYHYRYIDYK